MVLQSKLPLWFHHIKPSLRSNLWNEKRFLIQLHRMESNSIGPESQRIRISPSPSHPYIGVWTQTHTQMLNFLEKLFKNFNVKVLSPHSLPLFFIKVSRLWYSSKDVHMCPFVSILSYRDTQKINEIFKIHLNKLVRWFVFEIWFLL